MVTEETKKAVEDQIYNILKSNEFTLNEAGNAINNVKVRIFARVWEKRDEMCEQLIK